MDDTKKMTQMSNFYLNHGQPFIELYKLLKLEGIAETGGMAKLFIEDQQVSVNGQIETRKRRKLHVGDVVQISQMSVNICQQA